jgi:hypothetical protein
MDDDRRRHQGRPPGDEGRIEKMIGEPKVHGSGQQSAFSSQLLKINGQQRTIFSEF